MIANMLTSSMGRDLTFVEILQTILSYLIAFSKDYKERILLIGVVKIGKDMMMF